MGEIRRRPVCVRTRYRSKSGTGAGHNPQLGLSTLTWPKPLGSYELRRLRVSLMDDPHGILHFCEEHTHTISLLRLPIIF
jgi:hypothetical protein